MYPVSFPCGSLHDIQESNGIIIGKRPDLLTKTRQDLQGLVPESLFLHCTNWGVKTTSIV